MSDPRNYFLLGATGGIGSATARHLHAKGYTLALAARDAGKLDQLAGELGGAATFALDATDPDAVKEAVDAFAKDSGGLHGAANFVGSILLKPAHATKVDEWHTTIDLNLNTAFYLVRAAVPHLMKTGGVCMLCTSAVARQGFAAHEAIAAAKAGVVGLAQAAAASYASKGVRFNCLAPGLTDTPMASAITGNETALKASEQMHPDGRIGTAEEAARAASFLLDYEHTHITGQILGVDGGLGTVKAK
ncbi:MAG: SDR family oxidoreductase [Phycisphaerales bacterium]